MLDQLRVEDFLPFLGQTIDVEIHGTRGKLELAEAELINSPSPRATPPFHLILRSTENWNLTQGPFTLHLPDSDPLELFAVPIGPDGKGLCYEIIVN